MMAYQFRAPTFTPRFQLCLLVCLLVYFLKVISLFVFLWLMIFYFLPPFKQKSVYWTHINLANKWHWLRNRATLCLQYVQDISCIKSWLRQFKLIITKMTYLNHSPTIQSRLLHRQITFINTISNLLLFDMKVRLRKP